LWKLPNVNVLIAVLVGTLIYALGLLVTRFISKEDLFLFKNFFRPDPPISHP